MKNLIGKKVYFKFKRKDDVSFKVSGEVVQQNDKMITTELDKQIKIETEAIKIFYDKGCKKSFLIDLIEGGESGISIT